MVANTDTVVDPGAVMVESFHTLVADSTVTRSRSANTLAVRAERSTIEHSD